MVICGDKPACGEICALAVVAAVNPDFSQFAGRCSPELANYNARLRLSAKHHELPWFLTNHNHNKRPQAQAKCVDSQEIAHRRRLRVNLSKALVGVQN